ncbi:hypothetical protein [Rhodocista pekingensis]|uniref:Uncharacterized protein n=1 Tax=Rhodocista pekingensis TaxID=201185 RepID=A0ABW2KQX4_9PROT
METKKFESKKTGILSYYDSTELLYSAGLPNGIIVAGRCSSSTTTTCAATLQQQK